MARSAAQIAAQKKAAAASAKKRSAAQHPAAPSPKAHTKAAPRKPNVAKPVPPAGVSANKMHGSGTGLTASHRYRTENVRQRQRDAGMLAKRDHPALVTKRKPRQHTEINPDTGRPFASEAARNTAARKGKIKYAKKGIR